MKDNKLRIGICGGTFNPIHNGHLIIAESIREQFRLDKVIFIPSRMPPHKRISEVTDAEHRYNMVEAAVKTNQYFEASRIELEREGMTYTVDTLSELRSKYGKESKLFFIVGADVIDDLLTWKRVEEVFGLCEFIAAMRPGYTEKGFLDRISFLKARYSANIHPAETIVIDISSTAIRERVKKNFSIKYLVPEGVERYIIDHRLYKSV